MSEYGFQDAEYTSEYLMAVGNIGLNGQFHMFNERRNRIPLRLCQ